MMADSPLRRGHPVLFSVVRNAIQMAAALALGNMATAGSLEDHRWKHRLLVMPAAVEKTVGPLDAHGGNFAERDVRVVRLVAAREGEMEREIFQRFGITADSREVLLIGKDGATTVRWAVEDFTMEKLFQRIDAMPMRQREMGQADSLLR
jgi:hypothetical protein